MNRNDRRWVGAIAAALVIAVGAAIAAYVLMKPQAMRPDAEWHRRALVEGHLAHWLAVAPTDGGMLQVRTSRTWQPREQNVADLVGQSRQIYVLLSGYELTSDPRYLDAARRGTEFLVRHFPDPAHGGMFRAVDAKGVVTADFKFAYGHAFAIFALAHAYRVTKEPRYRDAAMAAWRAVDTKLREPGGGFRPETSRDFAKSLSDSRTQNPLMHLFEALLALYDATGDLEALAGARGVGDFVVGRLLRTSPEGGAYIAEWYNARWEPLPGDGGGYIDLGHQFEWAHLLSSAGERGLPATYAQAGQQVLDYAIRTGYDEHDGGCFARAGSDGRVVREKGYWQQSECLRALMRYAALYGKPEMTRRYEQTLAFIQDQLIDTANGGWLPMSRKDCEHRTCSDEQPDAYHMTAMHREALELAARGTRR
jgi:cellobiose epimerase